MFDRVFKEDFATWMLVGFLYLLLMLREIEEIVAYEQLAVYEL